MKFRDRKFSRVTTRNSGYSRYTTFRRPPSIPQWIFVTEVTRGVVLFIKLYKNFCWIFSCYLFNLVTGRTTTRGPAAIIVQHLLKGVILYFFLLAFTFG
jgi:hypothetical protein